MGWLSRLGNSRAALSSWRRRLTREDRLYQKWIRQHDTLTDADRADIRAHISNFARLPTISVIMPAWRTPERVLRAAIGSVRNQLYQHWELCVVDDASPSPSIFRVLDEFAKLDGRIKVARRDINGHISMATNDALALATGEFVAFMDHDDLLAEHALYEVAVEINARPDADIIYSDEDRIDEFDARHTPYFKTDWNPELFFTHNMINHLAAYRRSLVMKVGGCRVGFEGSQDYDLALRCVAATSPERIRHIPAILYHWRAAAKQASFSEQDRARCIAAARRAKAEYFQARGERVDVSAHPVCPDWDRVRRAPPDPAPLVSIVVDARLARSIVEGTDYPALEILGVETGVSGVDLASMRESARRARGEIIGFVGGGLRIENRDWLAELVSLAITPDHGAIGGMILGANGRVEHAGYVLAPDGVAHSLRREDDDIGYYGRLVSPSHVSAVSLDCLFVRKAIFDEVGGLDAASSRPAEAAMNLCRRLAVRGLATVFTPYARLRRVEKASAAATDASRSGQDTRLFEDPYYNRNLAFGPSLFTLGFPPRREKPWKRQ
jgi:GT2 family glycosyltransferase